MRMRDMGPEEAFARAEEQLAKWLREEGGSRLEIEVIGIGLVQRDKMWMTVDGEVKRVLPESSETGFAVDHLREKQVVAGWGAWTWCRLWMVAGEWVLHQECDWMREPVLERPPIGEDEYSIELDLYPRDAENIPVWLAERVAANEKRKAANARRREARRARKKRERQAAQAQAAEAADRQGGQEAAQSAVQDAARGVPGAGQAAQDGGGAGGSAG